MLHEFELQSRRSSQAEYKDCLQIQIFGDGELEPNRDAAHMVAIECCKMDFPLLVCQKLAFLDFESRKDAAQVKTLSSLQKP